MEKFLFLQTTCTFVIMLTLCPKQLYFNTVSFLLFFILHLLRYFAIFHFIKKILTQDQELLWMLEIINHVD